MPPPKCENTGTPAAPSARYTANDMVPFLPPINSSEKKIAKTWSVNGTDGTIATFIHEQTTVSAHITDILTISETGMVFLSFIFSSFGIYSVNILIYGVSDDLL